jgi:hypothetical protein
MFQRKGHVIMDVCENDGSLQVWHVLCTADHACCSCFVHHASFIISHMTSATGGSA